MLYVYAIAEHAPRPLPACRGHRGAPLRSLPYDGLAAICTRHRELEVEPSRTRLLRHARVAEALMDDRAVLPARFGATAAGADEVVAALTRRREAFAAALELVRGRVELGVRALWQQPVTPPAAGGAGYLRERLAARSEAERRAAELHHELAAHAVAAERRVLATPRLLLSGAYLVEREAVDAFVAAVGTLERRDGDVRLLCTGPWPPYGFVPEPDEGDR